MQSEEAVEIDHRLARNIDAGAHGVIWRVGVGNHNVESIGRTALKDHDQAFVVGPWRDRAKRGASQKCGHRGCADQRQCAIPQKYSARKRHKNSSWLLASS